MKVILEVGDREKIDYTGDLIILKDVGDRAEINVVDGSVIVMGKVGIFSNITARTTIAFKHSLSEWDVNAETKPNITSNLVHENKFYCQKVQVNNRIFTENALAFLGIDLYEIKSINELMNSRALPAEATVDGAHYKGYSIFVMDKAVIVDNELKHAHPIARTRVEIRGNLGAHSEIFSEVPVLVSSQSPNCTIKAPNLNVVPIPDHNIFIKNGLFSGKTREFFYDPTAMDGWVQVGSSTCFSLLATFKDRNITKLILNLDLIEPTIMEQVQQIMQDYVNPSQPNRVTYNSNGLIKAIILHIYDGYNAVERLNKLGNIYCDPNKYSNYCI